MQKRALEDTIYCLAAGAFGVFLRWLQLQLAFDENGLCGPSVFNVLVPLYLVVAAVVLHRRVKGLLGGDYTLPQEIRKGLANPGRFYAFLRWFAGGLMMLGGLLMIRGSETEKHVLMIRLLGGLAILTGICFPLMLDFANRELGPRRRRLLCLLSMAPIVLFALWLIADYQSNAINSVIWAFVAEVAAVSVLMVAFFRLAGFAFGTVETKKTLFWLQFGVVMSMVALADTRSTGMQIVFFSAGFMLALADFIWLRKLREKTAEEQGEAAPAPDTGGFDRL